MIATQPRPETPADADETFRLAPFRRPIRGQLGPLAMLVLVSPVGAILGAYPLILLGFPARPAIALVAVAVLVGIAWLVWNDHREQPAGTLAIGGGRVRFDAWPRPALDVPIADVEKALVVRYGTPHTPDALVIWVSGRSRIAVHEARLPEGVTLEQVGAILAREIGRSGDRSRFDDASARRARLTQLSARIGKWAAVAATIAALLRVAAMMLE